MGKTSRRKTSRHIKKGGNSIKSIIPPMISTLSGGTPQQVANERVLNMATEHNELINGQSGGSMSLVVPQMNTGMLSNPQDGNHLAIKGASHLLQSHANSEFDSALYSKPIQSAGKKRGYNKRKKSRRQRKQSRRSRKLNKKSRRQSKKIARRTRRNSRK